MPKFFAIGIILVTVCITSSEALDVSEGCGDCFARNRTCVETNGTFSCECPLGLTGPNCDLSFIECDSSKCNNNGKCIQNILNREFTCVCNAGYFGTFCDMSNLCLNSRCQNGATCFPIAAISYRCFCPPGLTGFNCDRYISPRPCSFNLCKNGGNCTIEPSGLIQCACPPKYIGNACEYDTSVCYNQTCSGHGLCQTQINSQYRCLCDPSYGGKHCEIENICRENVCLNGGVCQTVAKDEFKCFCPTTHAGDRCEFRICELPDDAINTTETTSLRTRLFKLDKHKLIEIKRVV